MSLADRVLRDYRSAFARIGGTIIVRRYSGTGAARTAAAEAETRARIVSYQPHEIVGAVIQGDRKAIVLNDPSAAVPAGKVSLASMLPLSKHTDSLVISGSEVSIEGVDDQTRRIEDVLIALELQVRG